MNEITVAIIAGFLAAGTGWFLDRSREKEKIANFKHIITTGICDDLRQAINLYDKINGEWDKTNIIWFTTINEFRESRQTYHNHKDWIVLFKDADLRKKIFRYYLESADTVNQLEYYQKRKNEIETRNNEIIYNIKMNQPGIVHNVAVNQAWGYMVTEAGIISL